MPQPYTTREELPTVLHIDYIQEIDRHNPGVIDDLIPRVDGEIDDLLRSRYVLPLVQNPQMIINISTVIVAYRALGSITSLIETERDFDNEFKYLQTRHKNAWEKLKMIGSGKLDIGLDVREEPLEEGKDVLFTSKTTAFPDLDKM